ncbi:MAG: 5-oxoprolinase subunit B family protein [Pelagimonas sp.]|uniref:5-oxoprolinase subunit B family protein n=1 Tax=Pelagimonas sp. TaxID=2073170 RepID=UPI003D6B915A
MTPISPPHFPRIDSVGLDGVLVRFAGTLSEPANRAALAFRVSVEQASWEGVEECSTSLVSTYLRFDPLHVDFADLSQKLHSLIASQDWYAVKLPQHRRLHRIPTVYGTDLAPQLAEAAKAAGQSQEQAISTLSTTQTRVTTIGFAPGQPYLGTLPPEWDIPRQTGLTPLVPVGALVVAIRQLVLFSVSTPTGWRHIGQTAAHLFQPTQDEPFLLRPGDEILFPSIGREAYETLTSDPTGGIISEPL